MTDSSSLPSWPREFSKLLLCVLGLCSAVTGEVTIIKPLKSIKGNVEVDTPYGKVRGVTWYSQYEQLPDRLVNVYLGVPYAKTLEQHGSEWREKYRFHNPDDDPYWFGTYDATKHKPACPQMPWYVKETVPDFSEVSEDCLYLDIYTPNIATETSTVNPVLYPVIVFLHGGGFIMGASRQWPGVFLAERFTVVVVVNFRQNALGFLSTGDRYSPGNYGMFDQIKAMQFVKKTIRSFRGNPQKITLIGHSSGAAAVGMHLLSARSVGLFNRAAMLSGSELSEWAVLRRDEALEYAKRLCREVGCPSGDSQQMVDCLRHHRSFEQIVNASAKVPMLPGRTGNPWAPVVDGPIVGVNYAFLSEPPADLRRQVGQKKVSLMVGTVRDEGAYFIPNLPNLVDGVTEPQFSNIVDEFIRYRNIEKPIALKDAIEFQYTYWPQRTNISFVRKKLIEMMGDYMFGAAISETIRQHVQHSAVYSYVFEYSSWRNYIPQWRGISHGQDLDYIFGFPFINETYRHLLGIYPRQMYDYSDRNISEFMINMITNFTNTGHPTPFSSQLKEFRNVRWFHYNKENHTYLSINNVSRNMANYRQNEFHFWNDYYPKLAGYTTYYQSKSAEDNPPKTSSFELATWSLTAVCAVLLFTVICLAILLCRRSRTKKYPEYDSAPPISDVTEKYPKYYPSPPISDVNDKYRQYNPSRPTPNENEYPRYNPPRLTPNVNDEYPQHNPSRPIPDVNSRNLKYSSSPPISDVNDGYPKYSSSRPKPTAKSSNPRYRSSPPISNVNGRNSEQRPSQPISIVDGNSYTYSNKAFSTAV